MQASTHIIGIRFQRLGKIYHFDASRHSDVIPGDFVLVETTRGTQLGQVIQVVQNPQTPAEGGWKPIVRRATPQDLVLHQSWQQKELEVTINCRAKASELRIYDVKFVASEFSFDGGRVSILYSNESGERLELRELRRAMQRLYPQTDNRGRRGVSLPLLPLLGSRAGRTTR